VSSLYHTIDKGRVPDAESFDLMAQQAVNVKQKYRELKDARDGQFCDLITLVVRAPYDLGDCVTVWVTDYTENSGFYPLAESFAEGSANGEYAGYAPSPASQSARLGPAGKMSLQVTCWEPHASVIRTKVQAGAWVSLRNVHIRYGRNNAYLEGFLREDRKFPSKVNVDVLLPLTDLEEVDPRLKSVIRRKHTYERNKTRQHSQSSTEKPSKKRRPAEEAEKGPRLSSKRCGHKGALTCRLPMNA